jgi:hypothetical protein
VEFGNHENLIISLLRLLNQNENEMKMILELLIVGVEVK